MRQWLKNGCRAVEGGRVTVSSCLRQVAEGLKENEKEALPGLFPSAGQPGLVMHQQSQSWYTDHEKGKTEELN